MGSPTGKKLRLHGKLLGSLAHPVNVEQLNEKTFDLQLLDLLELPLEPFCLFLLLFNLKHCFGQTKKEVTALLTANDKTRTVVNTYLEDVDA